MANKKTKIPAGAFGQSVREQAEGILNKKDKNNFLIQFGKEIEKTEYVSTGSTLLDGQLNGGFKVGSFTRVWGEPESGKSSMSLCWASNWQRYFLEKKEKPFVVYFNIEGRMSRELLERTTVDTSDDLFLMPTGNIRDDVFNLIENFVKDNPNNFRYFFILDSLDALNSAADLEEKDFASHEKTAAAAQHFSMLGRRLSSLFYQHKHHLFVCSQVRAKMPTPGSKAPPGTAPSGGNAPNFYSSLSIEMKKACWNFGGPTVYEKPGDKKTKIVGRVSEARIAKSHNEKTEVKVPIPLKYGLKGGIWRAYEAFIVNDDPSINIFEKSGAWYQINKDWKADLTSKNIEFEEKFQGQGSLIEYLDQNTKLTDYILDKWKTLVISDDAPPKQTILDKESDDLTVEESENTEDTEELIDENV